LFQEASGTEPAETSMDTSAHQILHAHVDPIAWKTELERVAPKLRSFQQNATNEWRAHVDQTVLNKSQIKEVVKDTHGDIKSLNRFVCTCFMFIRV